MRPGLPLTRVGSILKTPSRSGPRVRCAVALVITLSYIALAGCGDSESTPSATPTPGPTATPTVHVNQPPVLAPLADHDVPFGSDLLLPVSATDPEGQTVTISASGLPEESYFLPVSGIFCFFASDAAQLDHPIHVTFTASDGELSTSETVTIRVVQQGSGGVGETPPGFVLDPIGDRSVRVGESLTIQLSAHGASPIVYKMFPEAAIAPHVSLNPSTGLFQFTPAADQAGKRFEITFQACVPEGNDCSATAQVHETIHIGVLLQTTQCPDYVPQGCTELAPGMTLPQPVTSCYVVKQAGTGPYVHENVNILKGGALYFVEDPGKTIDFQVKSMLVEYGGVLQAGSPSCRFGAHDGTLSIGLYGDDPSMQATVSSPPPGIQCMTNPGSDQPCFPAGRDPMAGSFYCTVANSDDPCSSTVPPETDAKNFLLEHYHPLNFDPTPFGYKTVSVSYGGSLRFFGQKGTSLSSGFDASAHCDVPTPQQSTLDNAEMQAWANLTGSSWTRLQASQDVAADKQTLLTLDRVVSDWQMGDQIVVGTTDWYPGHSELRTILAPPKTVSTQQGMRTQLAVATLDYPHNSEIFDAAELETENEATYTGPVNRKAVDLRAAVGLLSRSIQVYALGAQAKMQDSDPGFPEVKDCLDDGTGNKKPECYFGGHLMFRQGFREVQISGAEFKQLGQGGRIGHYPVHFHLAKSTAYTQGKAFLKDSSVWDSMTRFVTLHGTHDVTVSRNVGYLSVGHGYYIEDGSEIDNKLCHNVGIGARAALNEYYVAQANPKNWEGNPPAPSLASRFVPPILDGVCPGPKADQSCPCLNPPVQPPPPTPGIPCGPSNSYGPALRNGSDSYMPVMYWMMNAYNEFVGNLAAGVYGFGSCFWLLGSGVSGPSFEDVQFDGFANYNHAGAYQTPLLRFRGNSCTTATYGLPASAELSPAALGEAINTGYTAVPNPYITNEDGSVKPFNQISNSFDRPAVVGNFQPIEPNDAGAFNCSSGAVTPDMGLTTNTQACVTTIVDRFTTSFNWAERNYGSIWFRPWFYLLLNSAETDQLFGGATFVSAGSWIQVPPAYFSLAKNSLFVGSSQHGGSQWASRAGPLFEVTKDDNLALYGPCAHGGKTTCNLESEGTGFWTGGFQPKRMINIYDGPHFADGNLFVNVGSWECDPQPCTNMSAAQCQQALMTKYGSDALPCGIYSSTTQPSPTEPTNPAIDPHKMIVLDTAIGWKQPNGFYYPPAFTYRGSTFFKSLPTKLPNPDPANPLDQCFSFGASNGYSKPLEQPGDCRHYVIDRTWNYIQGSMLALNGGPGTFPASLNLLPTTPIDFSTILIDLDGSLTGADGMISGVNGAVPTTSLSRNAFFDAPAQTDECLSFGLQTSPYEFVTTLVAPLIASPPNGGSTFVDPLPWKSPVNANTPGAPLVAIYRQWATSDDPSSCGQICNGTTYGCIDSMTGGGPRGSFMVGPNVSQAPYLTMAVPPGSTQPGSLYYIDTSTGSQQPINCVTARTGDMFPATFNANSSYIVYNLFARNDAVLSYQLFVGDGVNGLGAVQGKFVRVNPHLHASTGDKYDDFRVLVDDVCEPGSASGWCKNLPVPTVTNGILTFTLDQKVIADDFKISARDDYERCMPRDLCYFDGTKCQPCATNPAKCIRQSDFLSVDVETLNQPDATGKAPLDVICNDWASYSSGTSTNTEGELSLIDCPANGCIGFAFTLPGNFVGNKTYQQAGAPLAQCFKQSSWLADNKLVARTDMGKPADPLCGDPRPAVPADFCTMP
jgi:cell surface hyaluronidase